MKNKKEKVYNLDDIHDHSIDVENRIIYLHSILEHEDVGIDYRVAASFLKNICLLSNLNKDPIIIIQNTIGGSWFDGMSIFDAISNCDCKVLYVATGEVASLGSILLQAKNCVRMTTKNSTWCIHEGSLDISGSCKQSRSIYEMQVLATERMYNIYADRCIYAPYHIGSTKEKVINFIRAQLSKKEDWYLSAEEAVKYGFADIIITTLDRKGLINVSRNMSLY